MARTVSVNYQLRLFGKGEGAKYCCSKLSNKRFMYTFKMINKEKEINILNNIHKMQTSANAQGQSNSANTLMFTDFIYTKKFSEMHLGPRKSPLHF